MSTQPVLVEPDSVDATRRIVYLAEYSGTVERKLLTTWLARNGIEDVENSPHVIFYERPLNAPTSSALIDALALREDLAPDTLLGPLRVVWLPRIKEGKHTATWRDALRRRNPRNPKERRKAQLIRTNPERYQIVEAEPARIEELRQRWQTRDAGADAADVRRFSGFVARQAELSLERAEYRVRGPRYKIPRVFKEDVANSVSFAKGIATLAGELDRTPEAVHSEALTYLDELRTAHDPFVLDLTAKGFRWCYTRGYGEVDIVPEEIEMLRTTFAGHPVALLPSHKTNLDSPVLEAVLAEQNLPPPTLFAGINMSFWPVGSLMRRAGRVFLRRKIADNPVYRFALREWLAYLLEKRFNLEWFPEGTRSRTGKLLPPKVGLLSYAAAAYRQGQVQDLMLVPISILYDQAFEVSDFAREALGEEKPAENIAWMVRTIRQMRQPQGKVYMRIGKPVSMREALGPQDPHADNDSDEARLAVQKLALSVAWRTNQITPITGIGIVTFALLAAGNRAVTMDRIMTYTKLLVAHAREREQPLTQSANLETAEQVTDVLGELIRTGVVNRHDSGLETVYSIAENQHLAAAFYRNSMLHHVLDRAIGELSVLKACEAEPGSRETVFWETSLLLRDMLKFEFFFRERQGFEQNLAEEMDRINSRWLSLLENGSDPVETCRSIFTLGIAHAVLRPFLEAYRVVADTLAREPAGEEFDKKAFVGKCQQLGRQYLLQGELRNPEAVSRQLFETGVQLVQNLKLGGPGPDLTSRRAEFSARARAAIDKVNLIEERVSGPAASLS